MSKRTAAVANFYVLRHFFPPLEQNKKEAKEHYYLFSLLDFVHDDYSAVQWKHPKVRFEFL